MRQIWHITFGLGLATFLCACAILEGNVPYTPPGSARVGQAPASPGLYSPGGTSLGEKTGASNTKGASNTQGSASLLPGAASRTPPGRSSSPSGPTEEDLFPLGPEDVLEVSVWNHAELGQTALVGPDGRVSLKLVGSLGVGGMTLPELKRELTGLYQEFVPEAEVTVSLKELNSFRIYVLGKVASPGEFKARSRLSVLQALALAGGLTPFAKDRAVRILRRAGSRDIVLPFDYRAVMEGTAADLLLQPGDRVMVP